MAAAISTAAVFTAVFTVVEVFMVMARFFHGRFFGSGFGFYGYGYPWWWDYPYYPYSYYGYDGGYGDSDSTVETSDPRYLSPRGVQAALAVRGYYSGRIDGVMGPETRAAIRSFQANQGLPVTGQIDRLR